MQSLQFNSPLNNLKWPYLLATQREKLLIMGAAVQPPAIRPLQEQQAKQERLLLFFKQVQLPQCCTEYRAGSFTISGSFAD